jgi:hypothetical protein
MRYSFKSTAACAQTTSGSPARPITVIALHSTNIIVGIAFLENLEKTSDILASF